MTEQNAILAKLDQMSAEGKAEREQMRALLDALAEKQKQSDATVNELRDMITGMKLAETLDDIKGRLTVLENQPQGSKSPQGPPHKVRVTADQDGSPRASAPKDDPMSQAASSGSWAAPPWQTSGNSRRSGRARTSSPGSRSRNSNEVILFELPEPIVRSRAEEWVEANLRGRTDLSQDVRIKILDFHDYITLEYSSAAHADECAIELKRVHFPIKLRSGGMGVVNIIRDTRTPEAKRRGVALHEYYDVLREAVREGHALKQKHRNRGQTSTQYYSVHESGDVVVPLCTVRWKDNGTEVVVQEVVPHSGLPDGCLAVLQALRPQ